MLTIHQSQYRINDERVFTISELTLQAGESWAFVGSNGSGKSTLASILTDGKLLLSGETKNSFRRIAHLSFEKLQRLIEDEWNRNNTDLLSLDEDDTGRTTADIIQEEINDPARCEKLAEQFGIASLLTRRFKYLSTGETRKALLCQILMSQPDLLVLDEPFEGLDVQSRQQLATLLGELSTQGVTIVLVLNRFDGIPDFVQYIGVLAECRLVKTGSRADMLADQIIQQLATMEALAQISLPDPDEEPLRPSTEQPRIILNKGHVYYNDQPIIDNLTWQVNSGEHWQIMGPNGAGKSTLLSLITGDHPQGYSNDLTLFGRRRGSGETIWDIKRHIGYVSSSLHQDYRVSSSVKTVLLSGYFDSIGVYNATSDKQAHLVEQWLQLLGLSDQSDKPFHTLSWGQQRLVLIARALVKHPTLLILDEPLQGLDPLNRELVKRWIDLLIKEGKSQLLFVSHHIEDAPTCITHRLSFVPTKGNTYQYLSEAVK